MEFVILMKVQLFHTSFHIMVNKIILYMYKKKHLRALAAVNLKPLFPDSKGN